MEISDDVLGELMAAGAAALAFNAPLSDARAAGLIESMPYGAVVDLGCGRGELVRRIGARRVAGQQPPVIVRGVDSDEGHIERARALVADEGLEARVEFEIGDAAGWAGSVDGVICIGASHAFGDSAGMMRHLAGLVRTTDGAEGIAIVGDGIWQATPTNWCVETFGELPTVEELIAIAAEAGWTVRDSDTSTLDEWDAFEHGWIGGVRAVGTPEAAYFADQRQAEYEKYRGVLGFAWLVLSR